MLFTSSNTPLLKTPWWIEIVGDGEIEGLVEVAEPFGRPQQDRRRQDREDQHAEADPGAEATALCMGADGATGC